MVVDNNKMKNLKKSNNKHKLNENLKETVEVKKRQEENFYKEIFKFIKNIEWAPWNIPLRRRLQTLAVAIFVFIFMGLPFVCIIFIGLLAVSF